MIFPAHSPSRAILSISHIPNLLDYAPASAFILYPYLVRRRAAEFSLGENLMDRSYKEDIPRAKRILEELKKEFSGVASTTDWTKLRIEPLLDHVKSLERLLRSPKFARETARLRRGVVMFHSDLVYLRENVKGLKEILEVERRSHRRRPVRRAPRR